jgi:hypothetical protein
MPRCRTFPVRGRHTAALLLASLTSASVAHACSLVSPWDYRVADRIEFHGTPRRDTVFAGPGNMHFTEAMGHFGRGAARAIYGQRVRVDRLSASTRRQLPPDVRDVLLVPWDYAADCSTVPWGRSAAWLPDTLDGVFTATLRPRAHWAGALPTLDIIPFQQPYRTAARDTAAPDWLPRPRLTAAQLLDLLDLLPANGVPRDTIEALALATRLRDDPVFSGRYPATRFLEVARNLITAARLRDVRVPAAGTWRLSVIYGHHPESAGSTLFVRTAARARSAIAPRREAGDTTLTPRLPTHYALTARATLRLDDLPTTCSARDGAVVGEWIMRWHGPPRLAPEEHWDADLEQSLVMAALDRTALLAWRDRIRAAQRAREDSVQQAIIAGEQYRPTEPVPSFRFTITRTVGGQRLLRGVVPVPEFGTVRVAGERLSTQTLDCDG